MNDHFLLYLYLSGRFNWEQILRTADSGELVSVNAVKFYDFEIPTWLLKEQQVHGFFFPMRTVDVMKAW